MSTMKGAPGATFSSMFADTLETHGIEWAYDYYVVKHKMADWEFSIWLRSAQAEFVRS